ncbi:MAG: aquaporin [Catenulispora sp. 13_1_20CM_3_70_7]|nr:MAG: aquaporin [Catenulispora sp. 13_1_20CM_3_70_7]
MADRIRAKGLVGEMAAEFAGTFILLLFGLGVVAQVVAGGLGGHDSIAWGWGFGVVLGVYVAGKISGAHLNPAVTIALAAFGGFSWRKVLPYSLAQMLGAFVAALIVRWNYTEVLAKLDPHHTVSSQGIFSTLPGNGALPVHLWGGFRDQVIGTAILLFCILAVTDLRNSAPAANLAPVVVGFIVVAIGPRLASFLTGFGHAFRDQYGDLYFWVPIVGPIIGALLGAGLYRVLVGIFLPPEEETPPGSLETAVPEHQTA